MTVEIIARPHPFATTVYRSELADGATLAEVIGQLPETARVQINGRFVAREQWQLGALRACQVVITVTPQDDDFGRIVGTIAIAIAAAYTGGAAASLFLAAGEATLASTVAYAAAATATTLAGTLALNALIPPKMPESKPGGSVDRLAAITGSRNRANRYGVVPRAYGRLAFFPPAAANPVTEIAGNDQYYRLLLCLGYGPLRVGGQTVRASDVTATTSVANGAIRIGQTDINSFEDVTYEIGPYDALTLYRRDIIETRPAVNLDLQSSEGEHETNLFSDDVSAIRTTATDTAQFSVDVTFPSGLFTAGTDGKDNPASTTYVRYMVESAPTGTTTWTTLASAWDIHGPKRETVRASRVFAAIGDDLNGQYDIRLTRVASLVADRELVVMDSQWSALRSIRAGQTAFAGRDEIILLAIRIRATDQGISGIVDQVQVEPEALLDVWNGSSFEEQATRNPAWAYLDTFRGVQNDRPVADADIDLDQIQAWADHCDSHGLTYDWVHDADETLLQRARDIASAGLGSYAKRDGVLSAVYDDTDAPVAQLITPHNSQDLRASRQYRHLPHALRVTYTDVTTTVPQRGERYIYRDGYDASNATRFEDMDLQGVTDAGVAWFHGVYHLRQAILRPETYTVTMDWEAFVATRGDRARIAYDTILVGLGSARVKAINGDASVIALTAPVAMESGQSYGVRFRTHDGTQLVRTVATDPGLTDTLSLDTPATELEVGDLLTFGLAGAETIDAKIIAFEPLADMRARLTLVDTAADIFEFGTAPVYVPVISQPPDYVSLPPAVPVIDAIVSDDDTVIRQPDGSEQASVIIAYTIPSGGVAASDVQIAYRIAGTTPFSYRTVAAEQGSARVVDIDGGAVLELRLRALSTHGIPSAWTAIETHAVVGPTIPPDPPTAIVVEDKPGQIHIEWTNPDDLDFAGVEVWAASANDRSQALRRGFIAADSYDLSLPVTATRYLWLRALDRSGNPSEWAPLEPDAGIQGQALDYPTTDLSDVVDADGYIKRIVRGDRIVTGTEAQGLNLTSTHFGYYDGAAWRTYIENNGLFYFDGDAANYIAWDGNTLTVRGSLSADDVTTGVLGAEHIGAGTIGAQTIRLGGDGLVLDGVAERLTVTDANVVQRVALGRLGTGPSEYGIEIKDLNGQVILSSGRAFDSALVDSLQTVNGPGEAGADVTGDHSGDVDALQTINGPNEAGADKTSSNTAAGFSGQGALATRNDVTGTYIRNAAVDTLHIAGRAVTFPGSASREGELSLAPNGWRTVHSFSMDNKGEPVFLWISGFWVMSVQDFNTHAAVKVRINRGGTIILGAVNIITNSVYRSFGDGTNRYQGDISIGARITAPSSLNAYYFQIRFEHDTGKEASPGHSVSLSSFLGLETKR